jgi:Flp pilus assembly protein TadD
MRTPSRLSILLLSLGFFAVVIPQQLRAQDSSEEGTLTRGSRAELAITVRDNSGEVVNTTASVKLYSNGVPIDQASTSSGRAFFVVRGLGDFSIVVDASGYKSAQKDVTVSSASRYEVDVNLTRNLGPNESVGVPAGPVLAPKAKEELVKGLKAIGENKLDDAQKHVSEAMKLAPGNPEVLYVQGVLFLKQGHLVEAQSVLEKSSQIDPTQARVFAALGMALCNQKKYAEAVPPLEKALQMEGTNPNWEAEWTLARVYYNEGQYDSGLKMAEKARHDAHGGAPQVDLVYAQCLTAEGRYEDSAKVLRNFLKSSPNSPDAATAKRWLDGLVANGKVKESGE